MLRKLSICLAVILLFLATISASYATSYRMVQLAQIANARDSTVHGINDSGTIVGNSFTDIFNAVYWNSGKPYIIEGTQAEAYGISNSGYIVGLLAFPHKGFLYNGVTILALDGNSARAIAVNDEGWSVGDYLPTGGHWPNDLEPCCWSPTGQLFDLGTMTGRAIDINNYGCMVGCSDYYHTYYSSLSHATMWQVGQDSSITTQFFKDFPDANSSYAAAINDSGVCVGYSGNHTVLWKSINADPIDFGAMFPSVTDIGVSDISSTSKVCGKVWLNGSSQGCGYVWDESEGLELLPDYGYGSSAIAINNSSIIVGQAIDANGNSIAVMWEPVPEPSSILALFSGIAGIGCTMLRKRTLK